MTKVIQYSLPFLQNVIFMLSTYHFAVVVKLFSIFICGALFMEVIII